jgi:hypothetical protein
MYQSRWMSAKLTRTKSSRFGWHHSARKLGCEQRAPDPHTTEPFITTRPAV